MLVKGRDAGNLAKMESVSAAATVVAAFPCWKLPLKVARTAIEGGQLHLQSYYTVT